MEGSSVPGDSVDEGEISVDLSHLPGFTQFGECLLKEEPTPNSGCPCVVTLTNMTLFELAHGMKAGGMAFYPGFWTKSNLLQIINLQVYEV